MIVEVLYITRERKEHLIVVEETVKQDERISVMKSCNEEDMYRCELEDNKTKKKKKQIEKDILTGCRGKGS
jgi:hypothetical protein